MFYPSFTMVSFFQADGLIKVYDIFSSKTIESSVRKTAAEQLAIMLQGLVFL
jgi:hypothetical protein